MKEKGEKHDREKCKEGFKIIKKGGTKNLQDAYPASESGAEEDESLNGVHKRTGGDLGGR